MDEEEMIEDIQEQWDQQQDQDLLLQQELKEDILEENEQYQYDDNEQYGDQEQFDENQLERLPYTH